MTISTLIWFFLGAFIVLVSFGGGFSLSRSSRRLGGEMYEETGRFISPGFWTWVYRRGGIVFFAFGLGGIYLIVTSILNNFS